MAEPAGLPHSVEAEQAVLGSILIDQSAFGPAAEILTADDFYKGSHRTIWRAMQALSDSDTPVDLVSVFEAVAGSDDVSMAYLATLETHVQTVRNVGHHALIVKRLSLRRAAIAAATQFANAARGNDDELNDLLSDLQEHIDGASEIALEHEPRLGFLNVVDFLAHSDTFPEVESVWARRVIAKNTITMISGPPKIAKSFFCQQLALCVSTGLPFLGMQTRKSRVAYVQVEIADRMLAERFRTQTSQFLEGDFGTHEDALRENLWLSTQAATFCLYSDHEADLSAANYRRLTRQLDVFGPEMIILDPLSQLLRCEENDNRSAAEALAVVARLQARYGAAIVLVHHWSKLEIANQKTGQASVATASRGAGKWADYASSVLNLHYPSGKDRRIAVLDFTYLRNRGEMDAIYLRRPTEHCLFFERDERFEVDAARERLTDTDRDIIDILAQHSSLPFKELVQEAMGRSHKSSRTVERRIQFLRRARLIEDSGNFLVIADRKGE